MSEAQNRRIGLREVLRIDIPRLHAAIASDGIDATRAARLLVRFLHEPVSDYVMRIVYCPPLPLLWGFRPGDGSAAAVIHQTYARELWKERGLIARAKIFAHFLVWPFVVFGTCAWFTALNGRATSRRCGKNPFRQAWEQVRLAAQHGILPPWYYMFDLFDDVRLERAAHYLRRDETKGGLFRLLKHENAKRRLQDKVRFAKRCRACGVETPEYVQAKNGQVHGSRRGDAPRLPRADLFAKPTRGRGGRSMEEWRYDGARWSRDGAPPLDETELMEHFAALSREEEYLIQRRLVPHRDLRELSGDVLTTVRMVTIRDESGGFEATHAVFRMPNGPGAKVDNFHAGGLAAKVDIETGELGPASDLGIRPDSAWHAAHPVWGARIEGRKLPYWQDVLDLARRAHAALPHWAVIGWDIAIIDDGPVVIEGNSGADLDIIQRSHLEPLGDTRFGELLAFHLQNRTASDQEPDPTRAA